MNLGHNMDIFAILLVFLPLVAAIVVGFSTSRINNTVAQLITSFSVIISAILSFVIFNEVALSGRIIHIKLFPWFNSYLLKAHWSIYIDTLTAVMLIVVTSVSALVHVYSIGYMEHDLSKPRFMSYLSLFTFCMLMLVSADNFMQLFFGWEGVGLCSYLLIGFWFKRDTANAAAIKAFMVNRVGDLGFALGIFLMFITFDSVEYSSVFSNVESFKDLSVSVFGTDLNLITAICLLLFIGAMGKSAQIGLHTWLPDAMEGPTPVSALIHAATMVTAGVFMVARCSPIFEYSPVALSVVTCVGAFTCLFAASVALVQNDIKKIIAYSTCSQLGYMFFACGVSAYSAGIMHLMTHAFFKALLFLGAGSVIHSMSDEQDIRKMGGIWKKIPYTYSMMWIGSLALAGIFPFAGYYSKDMILEIAFASKTGLGLSAYILGLIAAVFTAFYSWRLIIITFHGKIKAPKSVIEHIHESPLTMAVPLLLLAIGAVISGYIGVNVLGMVADDLSFWSGSILVLPKNNLLSAAHHIDHIYAALPLIAGVSGIIIAYLFYMFRPIIPESLGNTFPRLHGFLQNKWHFDEIYEITFVRSAKKIGDFLWKQIDVMFIDAIPNGFARLSVFVARMFSRMQNGFIYSYAFVMLLGLIGLLAWTIFFMG
jgi:NADH-quinone oxidoreductase subunit L